MLNYLKDLVIDNPLNIKRVNGDLPTTSSSNKNLFLLLIVFGGLGLTFPTVWAYLNYYTGSATLSGLIIVIVYSPIILKVISISMLDEAGNKKAYIDQMENEVSSLATIWEVQNIKEVKTGEQDSIGYIDYMDGSRSIILKMIMGSTMNKPESLIKQHFDSLERLFNHIDNEGYQKNLYVADEAVSDDVAMDFFYASMEGIEDETYVKVFTGMLDYIDLVSKVKGSVTVLYVDVNGWGANKHVMFRKLSSLPEVIGTDNFFLDCHLLNELEVNQFIADDGSLSSFDIEELKLHKFRNSINIGRTAVLETRDAEGNTVRTFNPKFEAKDNVIIRSVPIGGVTPNKVGRKPQETEVSSIERLKMIDDMKKKSAKPNSSIQFDHQEGEEFKVSKMEETDSFIQLMSEGQEITLGGSSEKKQ